MKKTTILATILSGAMSTQAANYNRLTIVSADGTTTTLPAIGLSIHYADNQLIATNGSEQTTLQTADLVKMFFTQTDQPLDGDVNSDGVVDVGDVMSIINVMAGIETDTVNKVSADLNGDGNVDVGDVMYIINAMSEE